MRWLYRMKSIERFINFIRRSQVARAQMLAYICIFSVHGKIRAHYLETYGNKLEHEQNRSEVSSRRSSLLGSIEWRNFPSAPRLFVIFRTYTTIWLSYIIVKFILINHMEQSISKYFKLELPLHCYLVGRYILDQKLAELTGLIFAVAHLSWRFAQIFVKRYQFSVCYFMLFKEHDLNSIYSVMQSRQSSIEISISEINNLSPTESLLINTMCYRIRLPTKVILRLRVNRTRDAHLELRRLISFLTLIVASIVLPGTLVLTVVFNIFITDDRRYISVYPKCDPYVQERIAKLDDRWSCTITGHHVYAFIGDHLENIALWLEGGLVTTTATAFVYLLNYDLVIHWNGIKRKINLLCDIARQRSLHAKYTMTLTYSRTMCKSNDFQSQQIRLLMAEINDFFDQMNKASKSLSVFLNGMLISCLVLCCVYTYFTRIKKIHQLPPDVVVVLSFLAICLLIASYGFLMVHRCCVKSYSTICSLMAYDLVKNECNYGAIIDYFAGKRSCFRIMDQHPFLATTFLTLIGWSFSCFCIISGMLQTKELYDNYAVARTLTNPWPLK
jgi:hypothetical protein